MNRILSVIILIVFVALGGSLAHAQNQPYRVVFDLTSRDSLDQRAVMRWIREITASNPGAELEVVMYGKGYELVMPEKSTFIGDVKDAIKNPHVSFKVCQAALKNNKVERSAVLADAQTVPDGIFEIITKQHQGWGYIKVSH
jgi:hypothetical protein